MKDSDPRVKRTRKLLLDAFGSLLAEKGFRAITVQDIADRATLNRATFYAHFVDKYALLDQMVHDSIHEALCGRLPEKSTPDVEDLRQIIVAVFEWLEGFRNHCRLDPDVGPVIEAKVQQELSTILSSWLASLPALDVAGREAAASMMSWSIFGAGLDWSHGKRTLSAEQTADGVLRLITGGLSAVMSAGSVTGDLSLTPAGAAL